MEREIRLPDSQRRADEGVLSTKGHHNERVSVKPGGASQAKEVKPFEIEDLVQICARANPSVDQAFLRKAYEFSKNAHKDQKRSSGEPFINHPLEVARILAEYGLDTVTVATGILHDTVEDTVATVEEIHKNFRSEERRVGKECRTRWSTYQ